VPSFDVVCEVDLQEVDNAIQQTLRDLGNRFDFKGTRFELRRDDHALHLLAADDFKLRQLGDVLREKLAKRNVPMKAVKAGTAEPGPAGSQKQQLDLQQGIEIEKAREIVKLVKETKLKVQAAIQADQVRVSGKKRDDLQVIMAILRKQDWDVAMQFTNFRE
jgi:uncharacterized protein YajQ (UPF0234 family)